MRKGFILTLFFVLFGFSITATNKNTSNDEFPTLWKTGKIKQIKGHNILREFGSGYSTPYVMYETKEQLIEDAKKRAKVEMWTNDSLEKHIFYLQSFEGGKITLKIVAGSIQQANTKNFTVIIQDINEVELFRETLLESIPSYEVSGTSTLWYNYGFVYLKNKVELPVRVFTINSTYSDEKYSKTIYLIND
jgi:hypothetical protein